MEKKDWKSIKHFEASEFNNPKRMVYAHVRRVDRLRQNIGFPILITSDFRDGDDGEHGKGLATDLIFPTLDLDKLYYLYLEAERHGFTGIGIYPHWEYKGKIIGGLHVDSRSPKNGRGARWICIMQDGKQEYISFTWENMTRYVIR